MADFDSAQKRYSAFGAGLDFMRVRPEPDLTIGTTDRLHLLPLFANIAAGEPLPGSGTTHSPHIHPGRPIWHRFDIMFRRRSSE